MVNINDPVAQPIMSFDLIIGGGRAPARLLKCQE
jgi:hypothetical protein